MRKQTMVGSVCSMLAALMLSSCATTQITNEWRNPDVTKAGPYKKIFVTAISKQESIRRQVEDAFKSSLTPLGAEGVPSYESLDAAGEADKAQLIKAVKKSGADAALVVRMVKKESRAAVMPAYYSTSGYYGGYHDAWIGMYEPATVYQYDLIIVEAKLYDASTEKMILAVSTETMDSGRVQKEIAAYAKLICQRLEKDGLVGAAP